MMTIKEYFVANSLEEAYNKLMSGKKNLILGGMMWLRMQDKMVPVAIDLSQLGLDSIEEKDDVIEIGAMTSLRQMEESKLLETYFGNLFKEAFSHIVGTQFRNTATIGGSVFSRFGFSDPLTVLLALDVKVELYGAGIMSLEEFMEAPLKKDLLVKLILKKEKIKTTYKCQRQTATDFPNLTVCISKREHQYKIVVGARPSKAKLAYSAMKKLQEGYNIDEVVEAVADELNFGTNIRASKSYRMHLAKVLVRRGLEELS